MMVGDHQINVHFPAKLRFRHGGDAAVHGDDQFDALLVQLVDGDGIEAIALFQTAGYVGDAVGAVTAQKVGQQAGGGNTVHIIVAEYGDFFPPGHGKTHPAGGQVHVGH